MVGPEAPRSLADQLRRWPDARLATLLRERPDLATPVPQDCVQLASRAAVRPSLLRAMDELDRLELAVLDALVVVGPCDPARLRAVVYADPAAVTAAVQRLVDRALAWESPEGLRILSGVADGFTGAVGGSGLRPCTPPAQRTLDDDEIRARLDRLGAAARALLDHLDAHGGEGQSSARVPGSPEEATTPVEELLAHGLVRPRPGSLVVLPGEVGLVLRGGRTTREPVDVPPPLALTARDQAQVDRTAAGAAFEAVRRTELLLETWGVEPPPALRSGGLGVRALKAAAALLHLDETTTVLLVETAAAAGLLSTGTTPDGELVWLPTDEFDAWVAQDVGRRWLDLAEAWQSTPRLPGLVGGARDSADGPPRATNALAPELSWVHAAETRRRALATLAELPEGQSLATATGVPSLVAHVTWQRPRRPRIGSDLVAWTVQEGAALGLLGLGAAASAARHLLAGDPGTAVATLAELLPEPVTQVLLQADLTAVAPGPLDSGVARQLHQLADVESRGGATVHRFTPSSVRRGLDAGWSAAEIHAFLAEVSRTPVPQPLSYLVDDVARTFGRLRVGPAEAYLRADDETTLTELLHHPAAAGLELRRLAPTVLVSTLPIDLLLPRLRELGAAPALEAADGTVRVARPDQLRARSPKPRRTPAGDATREAALLAAAVTAIRAGDRARAERPSQALPPGPSSPAEVLAVLREAAELARLVWIGYADQHGAVTERVVEPRRVEGGQLVAYDPRTELERSFAIHRITAVRAVNP